MKTTNVVVTVDDGSFCKCVITSSLTGHPGKGQ